MKLNNLDKIVGSGFYSGYLPFAPGTMGSLVALGIYLIPGFENPFLLIPVTIIFLFWGVKIATNFEKEYGKDPKQCVIDEFVGMWISLFFVPKTIVLVLSTFVIWRVFDILKPYPANKLEKIKGGWGIMLDDVMSGIYTFIIIHIIIYFTY